MEQQDNIMLHYIFNESAHLKTMWTIPTVKPWIQLGNDPELQNRLQDLNSAQALYDFLARYKGEKKKGTRKKKKK